MQRAKSKRSALLPDENQSLFKFMLYFHENTDEYHRKSGKPWVWYSYDFQEEREMFPPGLQKDLRNLFTDVLRRVWKHEELYLFLRECYPQQKAEQVQFYMPKWILPQAQTIGGKYSEVLQATFDQLGIPDWRFNFIERSLTTPGTCPSKTDRDFYGTRAFEQNPQISNWFSTRKLKVVRVYDNRCFHPDNLYGSIGQDDYPEPSRVDLATRFSAVAAEKQPENRQATTSQPSLIKTFLQPAVL